MTDPFNRPKLRGLRLDCYPLRYVADAPEPTSEEWTQFIEKMHCNLNLGWFINTETALTLKDKDKVERFDRLVEFYGKTFKPDLEAYFKSLLLMIYQNPSEPFHEQSRELLNFWHVMLQPLCIDLEQIFDFPEELYDPPGEILHILKHSFFEERLKMYKTGSVEVMLDTFLNITPEGEKLRQDFTVKVAVIKVQSILQSVKELNQSCKIAANQYPSIKYNSLKSKCGTLIECNGKPAIEGAMTILLDEIEWMQKHTPGLPFPAAAQELCERNFGVSPDMLNDYYDNVIGKAKK